MQTCSVRVERAVFKGLSTVAGRQDCGVCERAEGRSLHSQGTGVALQRLQTLGTVLELGVLNHACSVLDREGVRQSIKGGMVHSARGEASVELNQVDRCAGRGVRSEKHFAALRALHDQRALQLQRSVELDLRHITKSIEA